MVKLEEAADGGKYERLKKRNILLFRFLYATGLRVSEVSNLKVSHINFAKTMVRVINGKGGKDRDVPIS